MAFGNVIPIDAEVARQLARREVRFRWLVAGLVALWLGVLVPTLVFTPLPPLVPFIALAVLVFLAEHRFVLFGDETSMSASIIVIVASVFVFADTAPLSGPLLIASIAGLYLPHLRTGALDKVAFNGGGMGLAAWSASIAAAGVGGLERSPLGALFSVAVTLAVYWTVNNLIVAGHQATLCGQRYSRSAAYLLASDTEVLLWAGAASIGTVTTIEPSMTGIAFVTAVLACRVALLHGAAMRPSSVTDSNAHLDAVLVWLGALTLLVSRGEPSPTEVALTLSVALVLPAFNGHACRLVAVAVPVVAILALGSGPAPTMCVLGASIGLLALGRSASSRWTACVAIGALGVAILTQAPFTTLSPDSAAAVATAAVFPAIAAMTLCALRSYWRSNTLGFWTSLGIAIPSRLGIVTACFIVATGLLAVREPLAALAIATAVIVFRGALAIAPGTSVGASR